MSPPEVIQRILTMSHEYTSEELGKLAGMGAVTIRRYRTGAKPLSLDAAIKLADAMGYIVESKILKKSR